MIERLILENWKSHRKTVVEFEPGTNVIIGINGAGKSSVLEAIYFALFGPPERGYYEKVLRSGEKEGYVELHFSHNGKKYVVKRRFSAKGIVEAELRGEDTAVITNRVSDVDRKIGEILGMSGDSFRQAVYARQNEMAEILQNKNKRKELMDEMLDISEISDVRDVLVAIRNRIKEWLRGIASANVEKSIRETEEEIDEIQTKIERRKRDLKREQSTLEDVTKNLENIQKVLEELEKKVKRRREAERALKHLEGEISSVNERIKQIESEFGVEDVSKDELEQARNLLERVLRWEKEAARMRARVQSIREEITRIEGEMQENLTVGDAERLFQEAKEKYDEKRKNYDELVKRRAKLSERVKNWKELLEKTSEEVLQARELEEEIKRIQERFGNVKERLEEKRKVVEQMKSEIARLMAEKEQETTFIQALQGARACPVCGSEIGDKKREKLVREHEERLREINRKIDELQETIENVEAEIKEMENAAERLSSISEQIKNVKGKEEEAEQIKANIKSAEAELEEIEQKITVMEEEVRNAREAYERAMRNLERAKKAEKDRKRREKLASELKSLERSIAEIEGNLKKTKREDIERRIRTLENLLERQNLLKKLEELQNQAKEYREEIERIGDVEEEYINTKENAAKLREKKSSTELRIREISVEIREMEERLKRLEKRLKELKEIKETSERRRKLMTALERMIGAVEETQRIVRDARIRAINHVLNVVWRGIYPRNDITEIRLRPERNDYVLEVKRLGKWMPVDMLSGGEFYDAALALRMAVSALKARNIGWLILDEPTHNLDREATEALARVLNQLPEQGLFKQIIVITHDETLQEAATGTVYLFVRDKDHNKPTDVKKIEIRT